MLMMFGGFPSFAIAGGFVIADTGPEQSVLELTWWESVRLAQLPNQGKALLGGEADHVTGRVPILIAILNTGNAHCDCLMLRGWGSLEGGRISTPSTPGLLRPGTGP